MKNLKCGLARLFRGWAQRLDPEFKVPPVQVTINRVRKIQVSCEDSMPYFPEYVIANVLREKIINALDLHGAFKIGIETNQFGGRKYTATIYAMIAGDEEGGVS